MAITHVASSGVTTAATAYGSTSITVAYTGVATGRLALLAVSTKPSTATIATPAGWTLVSNSTGGTGTNAAGTGTIRLAVFYRILDGSETGNVTVTISNTPSASVGVMSVYSKTLGNWATPMAVTASDTTDTATSSTATGSAWPVALAADDMLIMVYGGEHASTTQPSASSITQTGATFGTRTIRNYRNNSTGNDNTISTWDGTVTTGNANAPSYSITMNVSTAGAFSGVALREFDSTAKTAPTFPDSQALVEGTGDRSFPAVSTNAGDYLVVEANVEAGGGTAMTVSGGGLTYTLQNNPDAGANRAEIYQWTAPVSSGGSVTVALTAPGALNYRARVTVVRGSAGVGNKANATAGQTLSMTRTGANSALILTVSDWSTGAVGSPVWTPGGTTIGSQQGTASTYISGRWNDSGTEAPLPQVHGISSPTYTTPSIAVIEMLGSAGGATVTGAAAMTAQSTLIAAGSGVSSGTTALSGQSSLSVTGARAVLGISALSGQSTMAIVGTVVQPGISALSAQTTLTVSGTVTTTPPTATLTTQSSLTVTGTGTARGIATLTAQSNLTTISVKTAIASATLTGQSSMSVVGIGRMAGTTVLSAQSSLAVSGIVTITPPTATMTTQSAMTVTGSVTVRGNVTMSAQPTLSVLAKATSTGSAVLSAQTTLTTIGVRKVFGSATLTGQSSVTIIGFVPAVLTGAASMSAVLSLQTQASSSPPWVAPYIEFKRTTITSTFEGKQTVIGDSEGSSVASSPEFKTSISILEGG